MKRVIEILQVASYNLDSIVFVTLAFYFVTYQMIFLCVLYLSFIYAEYMTFYN